MQCSHEIVQCLYDVEVLRRYCCFEAAPSRYPKAWEESCLGLRRSVIELAETASNCSGLM